MATPSPKPADPKRSPQRAALEVAQKLAKKSGGAVVPQKSGGKDPYWMYKGPKGENGFSMKGPKG